MLDLTEQGSLAIKKMGLQLEAPQKIRPATPLKIIDNIKPLSLVVVKSVTRQLNRIGALSSERGCDRRRQSASTSLMVHCHFQRFLFTHQRPTTIRL